MRGGKVAAGVVALSLSAFGQASPARACSGVWHNCLKADPFPKNIGTVPANVPAVGYVTGPAETSYPWAGAQVELSTPDGVSVGGTIQAHPWGAWIAPDVPLQPGASYVMQYLEPCPDTFFDEAGTGGELIEISFTATDSVPKPTSFGTLAVASYEVRDVVVGVWGSCDRRQLLLPVVPIDYDSPNELAYARSDAFHDNEIAVSNPTGAPLALDALWENIPFPVCATSS